MSTNGSKNFYEVLQVSQDATQEEITKSYRRLARELHPDKNLDDIDADAKFRIVTEAYNCLKDPRSRAHYDATGNDSINPIPAVDPRLGHKLWLYGSFSYLAIMIADYFLGIGIEWFSLIIAYIAAIYWVFKGLSRHDFIIGIVTIIIYFIVPTNWLLKLSCIFVLLFMVVLLNTITIELDYTCIVLVIGFLIERYLRTAPTGWAFLAAWAMVISGFFSLVCIGFISDRDFQLSESNFLVIVGGNDYAIWMILSFVAMRIVDYLTWLVVPSSLSHWTFPSTWWISVCTIVLTGVSLVGKPRLQSVIELGGPLLFTYLFSGWINSTVASFIIGTASNLLIGVFFNALDSTVRQNNKQRPRPPILVMIICVVAGLMDVLEGRYHGLGAANWQHLSCFLASTNAIFLFQTIYYVAIGLTTATQAEAGNAEAFEEDGSKQTESK